MDAAPEHPGRLEVVGGVFHFSWWNCDRPISTFYCYEGTVSDPQGTAVVGAQVPRLGSTTTAPASR